jgi:hypothetical protein
LFTIHRSLEPLAIPVNDFPTSSPVGHHDNVSQQQSPELRILASVVNHRFSQFKVDIEPYPKNSRRKLAAYANETAERIGRMKG